MVSSSRTPSRPSAPARCDGFIIVPSDGRGANDALAAVRAAADGLEGAEWFTPLHAEPLSPLAPDLFVRPANAGRSVPLPLAWEIARRLREHRHVESAEVSLTAPGLVAPPAEMKAAGVGPKSLGDGPPLACSSDPDWHLAICHVPEAWNLDPPTSSGRRYGEGIVVGHPDTGFTDHSELDASRILAAVGYDFEDGDGDPHDPLDGMSGGHGTGTASVIMSGLNSTPAEHVTGAAPLAKLVPLRVSTSVVHLSFAKLTRAIYHSVAKDAHVISMSLGGPLASDALERSLRFATGRGIVPLAAAGNVWPWVVYPARYEEVIAVAACNCMLRPWRFSAAGDAVDVTAPGESVWRAEMTKKWDPIVRPGSGTSFAVATTAGVCALWLAYHGRAELLVKYGGSLARTFRELLMTSGVMIPTGWKTRKYGAGIVDAYSLLSAPLPTASRGAPTLKYGFESWLERLWVYFPEEEPDRIVANVARVLGVAPEEMPVTMERVGEELLFHLAMQPGFRASIARSTKTAGARSASARRQRSRLQRSASKVFLGMLVA